MFMRFLRGVVVLVSTAVAIPYTVAIVANVLNGWPLGKHKYRRALNPRKVYGLNYTLFQMLRDKSKFIRLYLRWKRFYRTACPKQVLKNIVYGRNDCSLDVYLPKGSKRNASGNGKSPVIIFIYGGSWSSGDKSMYGMLCSQIVENTKAVTICPNYSTYPKGYVDDMIQDVVDCIGWAVEQASQYGGDPNKIILVGHSAGAHLCAMAILELMYDERTSVEPSFQFQPAGGQLEDLSFAEGHYDRSTILFKRKERGDSSGSSESFAVVSENGADNGASIGLGDSNASVSILGSSANSDALMSSTQSDGFSMVESQDSGAEAVTLPEETDMAEMGSGDHLLVGEKGKEPALKVERSPIPSTPHSSGSVGDVEENDDESGDDDSVITVRPKDIESHATLSDLKKSVKAFIGLAGCYSIQDHFGHESMRGIEDLSCMARAHYGEKYFARFSPTQIIQELGRCLGLPKIVLSHGTEDYISPISSTQKFFDSLSEISADVKLKIIPGCGHYEICLDMMEPSRSFYSHVMSILLETVAAVS